MYNRYIRNDRGTYTRITEDDGTPRRPSNAPAPPNPPPPPNASEPPPPPPQLPHRPPPDVSEAPPQLPHRPPPDASEAPPQLPHRPPPDVSEAPPQLPHRPPPEMSHRPPPQPPVQDGLHGFLRHLLDMSHLENVDTGDLLLLCLLFLLYREGADEELLVALGLLLIL